MLARPESKRTSFALRRAFAARDWHEIVTFGFVSSDDRARDRRRRYAHRGHEPDRRAPRRDAHVAVARGARGPAGEREPARIARPDVRGRPRVPAGARGQSTSRHASAASPGARPSPSNGASKPRPVDFLDVKGDLEAIAHPAVLSTGAAPHPALHPGRSARVSIDGRAVGWLGELHPRLVRRFELGHRSRRLRDRPGEPRSRARCRSAGRSPASRSSGGTWPWSWTRRCPCRR